MNINSHYLDLKDSYLFATIAKKITEHQKQFPDKKLIRLGIGDVTLPLCNAVVSAMEKAVKDMGTVEGFHGYAPDKGYDFINEAIRAYYAKRNVNLSVNEIFISDGAKSDLGNILDIFSEDNTVLVPDPVYPVYVDTNIMAGRKIIYMNATEENDFMPLPDEKIKADIIYLCSPNNPTGAVYDRDRLQKWVDYANKNTSVILFDAAYEAYIKDPALPRSIFELNGAEKCAIEFCSLSKTAGFTGTRCGYTIVPMALNFNGVSLNKLWFRRQTTKFNGVSYITQCGAAAVFTEQGQEQIKKDIAYYMENADIIANTLSSKGIYFTGGINSPYIWLKCPNGVLSWDFFDYLMTNLGIIGTPGAGFGKNGEGFFRLTAFGSRENTIKAMERFKNNKI